LEVTCRPAIAFGELREESVGPFVHRRNILLLAAGVAATLVGSVASRQAAAEQNPAADLIQKTVDRVIKLVMTKTGEAREAEILRVLETDFDLNYMARSALGKHWNKATPDQRERFLKAAASRRMPASVLASMEVKR
jgi:phospholipid transport system substrate-binding protein